MSQDGIIYCFFVLDKKQHKIHSKKQSFGRTLIFNQMANYLKLCWAINIQLLLE